MRTPVQIVSFAIFTLLFLFAGYHLPDWLPADIFLRLDPLLGLSAVLAGREIIGRALWALLLIGATLFIGRFFCAYVCPMGASIDFLDFLIFRKKKRPALPGEGSLRKWKFYSLVLFLASAMAAISISYLLDPISLLTRFYAFFLYPLVITILNLIVDLFRPLFQFFGWMNLAHLHYPQPVQYMAMITFFIFFAIISLNRMAPRFWCRYLCPLGALLSWISPLGLWKRRVSEECNLCRQCVRHCPMGAIPDDPQQTRRSECIQCQTCSAVCPQQAISFRPMGKNKTADPAGGEYLPSALSRREFLYSFSGGLTVAFLADRTPYTGLQKKIQLIRPPGAIPEEEFLRTCVRCGECMKSCLTNTLQPSLWESGFSGLWTPRMDLRFAGCEQSCNVCGRVCPTQAIRSLPLEEKNYAKVGTAVLSKVWAQDKLCLVCDEICPYNAIVFHTLEGYRRPVVVAARCNGCGYCEQKCPVQGESAIGVVPNGELRLKEGSYLKEGQRLQREFKPEPHSNPAIRVSLGTISKCQW
ncbi:MAG: 4Fe-4S binding protein [Deltaproteobacteria bacterium]|nr:4Fe-4S binding protein [Deltaproteobacteria bacterium]